MGQRQNRRNCGRFSPALTKFATYTRDGFTKLDYADQRYYASSYGRFNTADRRGGNGRNPGSLNKYAYTKADPINRNDPRGLCDVVIGGITETPSNSPGPGQFATSIGANQAYPYANGVGLAGIPIGGANVLSQALAGANANTQAAFLAIIAAAQDPGQINIFTFSGGAQAFATAYQYLPASIQTRIGNISYVSPGGVVTLPLGSDTTTVVDGNGILDLIAEAGVVVPLGANIIDVNCQHDATCEFGAASATLKAQAGSPCSQPTTFSFGSVAGQPSMVQGSFSWPATFDQVSVVTSVITYEVVSSTITFSNDGNNNDNDN
jgi:RHS repeat-associated protein